MAQLFSKTELVDAQGTFKPKSVDDEAITVVALPNQVEDLVSIQNSSNTEVFSVSNAGNVTAAGTLAVTGTQTFTGATTFTAAPTLALGALSTAQALTPDDADGVGVNMITAGVTSVAVGANVNGVNDWITLPSLASVPVGHCITVVSNAAGHEVRTPASSAEEINSEDCDGTKEYAIAAANQIHRFTKIDDTVGWMGQGFTAIGAVVTAVVPD